MSKFQFGDIVRHKETGQTGSVIDWKFGVVVAVHGDTHIDTFAENELEPIPHPDTARLDFLIRKGGAVFWENQVGDWQACAPSCLCEIADPEWSGFGSSPREAIDAAIKLSE